MYANHSDLPLILDIEINSAVSSALQIPSQPPSLQQPSLQIPSLQPSSLTIELKYVKSYEGAPVMQ